MTTPALLCTGFHRSATSLVAQLLHAGGLHMGARLVAPHRSNPDGHFEDAEMVALHDAVLAEHGVSFALTDVPVLPATASSLERLRQYVRLRDSLSPARWGAKDPRLCLFLPQWQATLEGRGRFLLVTRHWAASLQSMLKRHSRLLAEQYTVGSAQSAQVRQHHVLYWQPGQLPRMWLAYAERMLQFAREHPGACVVVPHTAVVKGMPLYQLLNERWGFAIQPPVQAVIKPILLDEMVDERIKALVAPALLARMDAVWEQLSRLTTPEATPWLDAQWHTPQWRAQADDPLLGEALRAVESIWARHASGQGWHRQEMSAQTEPTWQTPDGLIKRLLQPEPMSTHQLGDAAIWLETHDPDNGAAWREVGRRALANTATDIAEQALLRAAGSGPAPAEVWALLAQVHRQRGSHLRALHYWREAVRRNPRSGPFMAGLIEALLACGLTAEADEALDNMGRMEPDWPVINAWTRLMQELGRTTVALKRIEQLAADHPQRAEQWQQLLTRMRLAQNHEAALQMQDEALGKHLAEANLQALAAEWLAPINGAPEASDLMHRLLTHWRGLLDEHQLISKWREATEPGG